MMISPEILISLAVALPFVAAALILWTPWRVGDWWSYIAAIAAVACSALMLPAVLAGQPVEFNVLELVPPLTDSGLAILFRVDALGLTFGLLASGLWVVAALYNRGYVRADNLKSQKRYLSCFAASIGAAMGIAYAGNILTFLLFYEALTLATYPLVVHKESRGAIGAGRRYIFYALSGGLAVTVGAAWVFWVTGTLDFTPGGFLHGHGLGSAALEALFLLLVGGCAVKAAIMPMHQWLPAAMVAPSPVSALLHAVAVVKAGVFGCMRMLGFVFGPESLAASVMPHVLLALCGATIVIGSLMALRQQNLKRRLAYSTVVHLSYIVLGAALLTPFGMAGAVLHMVNHGLAKITLFFCAGAIYATTHYEDIPQLRGLGRRMPWTCGAFTVASLGLIGIPGLCGFIGKLFLVRGAFQAEQYLYIAIMLGASLLTAMYLLPIVRLMFFQPAEQDEAAHHGGEARPSLTVPLVATAALVIVFGIVPVAINTQFDLATLVAAGIFGE